MEELRLREENSHTLSPYGPDTGRTSNGTQLSKSQEQHPNAAASSEAPGLGQSARINPSRSSCQRKAEEGQDTGAAHGPNMFA